LNYIQTILLWLFVILIAQAEKVEVTSDRMKAIDLKKEIHFIGNAKVTQLSDWIKADEIIVYFNENNETREYDAQGSVTFSLKQKDAHYTGRAQKVVYNPQKSRYILTGKAVIDDLLNKRHLDGDEIVLDMLTGNATVTGKEKKPVKFIFDMEKKSE